MRQRGKYGIIWERTRKMWVILNPPNHQGYYICWMCHKWIPFPEMELDHVESRTRHPELRYNLENLRPSCHNCNQAKGSREFIESEYIDTDDLENIVDF